MEKLGSLSETLKQNRYGRRKHRFGRWAKFIASCQEYMGIQTTEKIPYYNLLINPYRPNQNRMGLSENGCSALASTSSTHSEDKNPIFSENDKYVCRLHIEGEDI